jgi:hypothetical protein
VKKFEDATTNNARIEKIDSIFSYPEVSEKERADVQHKITPQRKPSPEVIRGVVRIIFCIWNLMNQISEATSSKFLGSGYPPSSI